MTIKPQFHWTFKLLGPSGRKGTKIHLSASDERGLPFAVTLCGKRYDPADRIDASKGIHVLTGQECIQCLRQLGDTFTQLRDLFLAAGASDTEAAARADEILKIQKITK